MKSFILGASVLALLVSAGCNVHNSSTLSALPPLNAPEQPTAAERGLWPRSGPAVPVCGRAVFGFVRCHAWMRADILGGFAATNFSPAGYYPRDLRIAYNLTAASANNGKGVTVAIVDAFNDTKAASDLKVYRSQFGLPGMTCTSSTPCFTKVAFGTRMDAGWGQEESLDVDMVSAICPNCNILLVEAATNSTSDLTTAERYATAHAHFVTNSWGGPEGVTSFDAGYNKAGVVITASTGDGGFNSSADWPAILPFVTAVGGTSLTSISPRTESAWSGAGSGCSKVYAKPAFQSVTTGCSKRAQSDVSAEADPNTGVAVYDTFYSSGWLVFGGTSVSSPIIASVFALVDNTSTNNNSFVYAHKSSLHDITSGSNGACGAPLCKAGAGWDGPTGLGTPNGIAAF